MWHWTFQSHTPLQWCLRGKLPQQRKELYSSSTVLGRKSFSAAFPSVQMTVRRTCHLILSTGPAETSTLLQNCTSKPHLHFLIKKKNLLIAMDIQFPSQYLGNRGRRMPVILRADWST